VETATTVNYTAQTHLVYILPLQGITVFGVPDKIDNGTEGSGDIDSKNGPFDSAEKGQIGLCLVHIKMHGTGTLRGI